MIETLVSVGSMLKPDPYLAALMGDWGLGLNPGKFSGFTREEMALAVAEVEGKARLPDRVREDVSYWRQTLLVAAAASEACVTEALAKRAIGEIQRQVLGFLDLGPSWREASLVVLRAVGSLGKLCTGPADETARALVAAPPASSPAPSRVLVVVVALAAAAAAWALWRVLR